MAERFLLETFQPVWNVRLEGFGIHDPGSGRHQGELPWWDALHPGRTWAANLRQTRTSEDAVQLLKEWFQLQDIDPLRAREAAIEAAEEDE
jgi:hypothetical protein